MKPKVVIFGSSGHAKVIADMIESGSSFELIGFIDKFKSVGDEVLGYKVIGGEQSLANLMVEYGFYQGVVGIGDNFVRSKVVGIIMEQAPNFQFVNCIHKSANISNHCQFGSGSIVMPGVTVNVSANVGDHCILNTNSSLDHDCIMKDFSSLGPNASVGGDTKIGALSHIGISAAVFQGILVGENCVIGGGSVVKKNARDNTVYFGSPAKYISDRALGDKYL